VYPVSLEAIAAIPAVSEAPTWTPEQEEIFNVPYGFHVVVANAGTGKTATAAELIVRRYVEEETKLFTPPPGGHVGGDQQTALLKQILAVTFTRDAAKELDDRIYFRFAELGIPTPLDRGGRRYRISRTIDAYVQRWMWGKSLIEALLKIDPDILGCVEEKLGKMPFDTRNAMVEAGNGNPCVGFFRAWPWLKGDDVADIIFDTLHRDEEAAIPGLTPSTWPDDFDAMLKTLGPPPPRVEVAPGELRMAPWGDAFWTPHIEKWRDHRRVMRDLTDRFQAGELAGHSHEDLVRKLTIHEEHEAARREFFAILELARSRGYHPVRAHDKLASLAVLQEIAASLHWDGFDQFHSFALRFYAEKLRYGVMDYTDFLLACVDTLEQNAELVERDKEYPRRGIRRKYIYYDETQDNSVTNNRLFKRLCAKQGVPYLAVAIGDAKQAIYGFRGACSYGFGQMIESIQKTNPQNIHHLTCSFRSQAKIVALGNECVLTLPSYKDTVHPSHTVYTEPGDIVIAPPLATEIEESDWVMERVREILYNTTESVLLLHRNNLYEHPIVPHVTELKKEFGSRITLMTIHRSKGLQAHHCFVMGLTATLLPDVRTSYNQSVNLLYVALTRPRKALYLTAPYMLRRPNKDGVLDDKRVGPSPFLFRLPTLCNLAQHAGWPLAMMEAGETSTRQAAALLVSRIGGKEMDLRKQWRALWPHVKLKDSDGDEYTAETGSAAPSPAIKLVSRRSLYEDGKLVLDAAPVLSEGIKERVEAKMRQAYMKNGQAPRLGRDEFMYALKQGWIEQPEGAKIWKVSMKFASLCSA